MVKKYGIVQGRLLPQRGNHIQCFPRDWKKEFEIAASLGVSHIEWIDGAPDEISMDVTSVLNVIPDRCEGLPVPISALCLDWLMSMDHLAHHADIVSGLCMISVVEEAILRLGIKRVVLPLLETASLNVARELDDQLYDGVIQSIKWFASEYPSMSFSLETDLDSGPMVELLDRIGHDNVSVTFDTGNLTRLGFDLDRHIDAYGDRIDNIHVKDCVVGGSTVQLGTGQTDLRVIKRLVSLPRVEHLTLQTARSPGSEIDTFKHNVRTIEEILCSRP